MDPSHFTYSTSTDHDIRDDNGNVIGSASVSITAKVPSGEDQAAKASEVLRRVAGIYLPIYDRYMCSALTPRLG